MRERHENVETIEQFLLRGGQIKKCRRLKMPKILTYSKGGYSANARSAQIANAGAQKTRTQGRFGGIDMSK